MKIKDFSITKNIWIALKSFFKEGGLDKSSILAYYSIFSSLFVLTFFIFIFTKLIGNIDSTLTNMYPFSPDLLKNISSDILFKAEDISSKLQEIGIIGIVIFIFLSFLVFNKIVQYVNDMFHIKIKKHLFKSRINEFAILLVMSFLGLLSFFFTGFISTITSKHNFITDNIDIKFINLFNNFLLKYLVPSLITFLVFFFIYKWIPEKKVCVKGALISSIISTLLWEVIKRLYAYYLVNISVIGQIKGPVIAIILFGFWMEISMGIMLFGAKLTHIFDIESNTKNKNIIENNNE